MQPQAAMFRRHSQGQPRLCTLFRELDTRSNGHKCTHINPFARSSTHHMDKRDRQPQDSRSHSRSHSRSRNRNRGRLRRQGPPRLPGLECQSGQPLVAWPGHTRLLHPVRPLALLPGVGQAWGLINCPAAADGLALPAWHLHVGVPTRGACRQWRAI